MSKSNAPAAVSDPTPADGSAQQLKQLLAQTTESAKSLRSTAEAVGPKRKVSGAGFRAVRPSEGAATADGSAPVVKEPPARG